MQTVRFSALNLVYANGYSASSVVATWNVLSAPNNSVFYPYDITTLLLTNVTTQTSIVSVNATEQANVTTVTVTSYYSEVTKTVILTSSDSSYSLDTYPVCFTPDVGGNYQVGLTLNILGVSSCSITQSVPVVVQCSQYGPSLSSIVTNMPTSTVARFGPTQIKLDASGVTDLDTPTSLLLFQWSVVYPTSTSINPLDGSYYTVPTIVDSTAPIATFVPPQANINYIIKLSVTDHCNLVSTYITIPTVCDISIVLENRTLAATYDGSVPIPLMAFAYDHTHEIQQYVYPSCQSYSWQLVDYSIGYSEALSTSTEFVQTSGFAGLISAVVIVAVTVPIILWLYFTKKACFKGSDPRV